MLANRKTLQKAMTTSGFTLLGSEWWHFDDADWKSYEVIRDDEGPLAGSTVGSE